MNWDDVEISHDMSAKDKVLGLGKIAAGLKKEWTELDEKRIHSTPPKVLESRHAAATQATKRIDDVEKSCAKAIDQVSQTWEALIDIVELEIKIKIKKRFLLIDC